jgi:hypothetical protein
MLRIYTQETFECNCYRGRSAGVRMSSVMDVLQTLTKRLPELEYRLDGIGKIRTSQLPKGLFRSAQFEESMTSSGCIEEIRSDLIRLKTLLEDVLDQTSPAVYLAKQVSLKMQVLLQLCQQSRRKNFEKKTNIEIKQLVTRNEWLDNMQNERQRLIRQQAALLSALEENKESSHVTTSLQHALDDVEGQLSSVTRMLATLTGCMSAQ